jgi:hypothetical protein
MSAPALAYNSARRSASSRPRVVRASVRAIIKKLGSKQIEILVSDFDNMDIKPKILKDYIMSGDNRSHIIYKDIT